MNPFELRRHRRPLAIAGAFLLIGFLLRLILAHKAFGANEISLLHLPFVVSAGLLNDLVVVVYALVPATLLFVLWPRGAAPARWRRVLAAVATYGAFVLLVHLAVTEFVFWDEFDSRFNLVAVDYLIYPHEVFQNIWESYPIIPVVIGDLALGAVLYLLLIARRPPEAALPPPPFRARARLLLAHGAAVALLGFTISTDTFGFAGNRVANELAANGWSSFFRALRTNELEYDQHYATEAAGPTEQRMVDYLIRHGGGDSVTAGSLTRHHPAQAGFGKLNVVVLLEESFGCHYVGACGGDPQLTPRFDALTREGLFFSRAFATGTRTVRGLEALITSLPPIPSEAIVKRSKAGPVANWGNVLKAHGYRRTFLYGGFAAFDRMKPFFAENGFEVEDRGDIDDVTFANVWGVSDQDLFDHAIDRFDRWSEQPDPFFAVVLSTSNHRPYTFPEGIPGVPPEGGGREAGIRYADYAIGRFFDRARTRPWFDRTLFVVVADHGARVYGRAEIPIPSYEIPLLMLAPGRLAPGRYEQPVSQIDIAPTVMGLLGLEWQAPFFGQDVLAYPDPERPILLGHNHDVALMRGSSVVTLGLGRKISYFGFDRGSGMLARRGADRDLAELAIGYFQTAYEAFREGRYR